MPAQDTAPIDTTRLTPAAIDWEDDDRPRSLAYADIYFSADNALAESRHVFLAGNDLPARFASPAGKRFIIGECGFGFGLNFLATCDLFCRAAPAAARLHYIGCENQPVSRQDLARYHATLPAALGPFARPLLDAWPGPVRGLHRLNFSHAGRRIILDLVYDEAVTAFSGLSMPRALVDAWYLDGFAPARNSAMWAPALLRTLRDLSHDGTTLATYSVAGDVRRGLEAAGFVPTRAPGYGRKRQMLRATVQPGAPGVGARERHWSSPWPALEDIPDQVAVIGGGLAGCATAHALAARGLPVTLVDRHPGLAEEASGNPRGIVHFNPGKRLTPATRFRLAAFLHAVRHYQALAREHDFQWHSPGLIQVAAGDGDAREHRDLLDRRLYGEDIVRGLDSDEVAHMSGGLAAAPGLFFPAAGSLCPPALCRAWSRHNHITTLTGHDVSAITRGDGRWRLTMIAEGRELVRTFRAIVICTNRDTGRLPVLPDYPLLMNHGQTDTCVVPPGVSLPDALIRRRGYLIPWHDGKRTMLTIGGCVGQGPHDGQAPENLRRENLALLAATVPALAAQLVSRQPPWTGRPGTRTSTPDYLPLAGPVEDRAACEALFAGYARNARRAVHERGEYLPGAFINVGHGAGGLVTTPLVAEYLASLICRDVLPLEKDLVAAIHPLRYLIRSLKRQEH